MNNSYSNQLIIYDCTLYYLQLKQSTEDDEIKQTIHSLLAYEGSHMAQMVRIHNTTQISLCVKIIMFTK